MFRLFRRRRALSLTGRYSTVKRETYKIELSKHLPEEVNNRDFLTYLCERATPLARDVLGVRLVRMTPGALTLELKFSPELAGHSSPVSMHGGVIAAAIDHAAGASWQTAMRLTALTVLHMWQGLRAGVLLIVLCALL